VTISVIIPVFHEEAIINDAIARLIAQGPEGPQGGVEIIVADGSPGGETVAAIKGGAQGIVSAMGRAAQMNAGGMAAHGDVLLFLHVDTALPAGGLDKVASVMEGGRFAGGAFDLGIADAHRAFRVIERVASIRSRLTRIPYGDQAIFMERDYFLRMGGYGAIPIMEDVDLMRRVKRSGGRICIIDAKVQTSARRWKKEGIAACTLRNWTIMLLYLAGVRPERLAKWYP
jgi:rSAM/selenodomain-associated transferase 2